MPRGRIAAFVLALAFGLSLIALLSSAPAHANPPSSVSCTYDFDTQRLDMSISHQVTDPATHYIFQVEVLKNSVHFAYFNYTSQPSASPFHYTYDVPADDGDVLSVTARCSQFGSGTGTVTVSSSGSIPGPGSTSNLWQYHAILMALGAVLAIAGTSAIYMKQMKWWLKAHKSLGVLAVVFIVIGLSLGIYMVQKGSGSHFNYPHAWLGIVTIIMAMLSVALGFMRYRAKEGAAKWRTAHIWLCRATIALLFLTIIAGMRLAGVI